MVRLGSLLLLAVALFALPACPSGKTCGRGRCQSGSCVNVFSTYVAEQELSLDWWCVVPCSAQMHCKGSLCLQSPVGSGLVVCAGDQVELKYTYSGSEITKDGKAFTYFTVSPAHTPGGYVRCEPNQVCSAGWFKSGEAFPTVTGYAGSNQAYKARTGMPGELRDPAASAGESGSVQPLGPLLPTGLPVVIHLDGFYESLE